MSEITLTLSTIEEAMQRAELAASVEWPGEFARQMNGRNSTRRKRCSIGVSQKGQGDKPPGDR